MQQNAGEIIELTVRRQNVNISDLSKRLNVNRRTLYNWFKQKNLHTDVILEIGKAIHYDFSKDFNGELMGFSYDEGQNISKKGDRSHPESAVYYWMEKYIALLEDYKSLLGKQGSQKMVS